MSSSSPTIVALVGPRACGKTSVGREVARRLRWTFVDLDEEVARARALERATAEVPAVGSVFAELGEPAFRELEARVLEEVLQRGGPLVLATGGGLVETKHCRDLLASRATCVWLRVSVAELERRMSDDSTIRPSLTGADPVAEVGEVVRRRESLYGAIADYSLDCRGLGVGEVAERVEFCLGRRSARGCRG